MTRPTGRSPNILKTEQDILTIRKMARVTGFEPATSAVTGRRSNQLSYTRALIRDGC